MANDLLHALIRANLAGGLVAVLLLALRAPLRKLIGPNAVYALWLALPAAGLASLLPPRTVTTVVHSMDLGGAGDSVAHLSQASGHANWSPMLLVVWLTGLAATAIGLAWRQYRFLRSVGPVEIRGQIAQALWSLAGPAVIGLIRPRILLPADFETRFSARERDVILAHEKVHLARGDSRINGFVLTLQCLNWFNPLAHIAGRALRLDQEMACDATVMALHPNARRSYAEAMLKSQMDATAAPAGCYWQARGAPALTRRMAMLATAPLPSGRAMSGLALASLLTLGAGLGAWSAQPVRHLVTLIPTSRTPAAAPFKAADQAAAPRSALPGAPPSFIRHPVKTALAAPADPVGDAIEWTTRRRLAVAAAERLNPTPIEWSSMPMPPELASDGEDQALSPDLHQTTTVVAANEADGGTLSTYRNGDYRMKSHFTRIGDKVQVSVQLFKSDTVIGAGVSTIKPGELAYVALSNGQTAQVAPGQTSYLITPSRNPLSTASAPS